MASLCLQDSDAGGRSKITNAFILVTASEEDGRAEGPLSGANAAKRRTFARRERGGLTMAETKWRYHGVRVIKANQLDTNTAQTPGMNRAAAINHARMGAEKLWAGTVVIHPKAKTGAHHHGPVESVIYVVSGKARMKWGDRLEFTAEAGPGDFIYVPPFVPHQEINASDSEPLSCVLCRSGQEPVVVNLDIPNVEPNPENVPWVDNIHPAP